MRVHLAILLSAVTHQAASSADDVGHKWNEQPGYRFEALTVPTTGQTGFTLISKQQTGITFTNFLSQERSLTNQIYLNGSGVALGDVDGDGRCDIYLCGLEHGNRLYRNLGGWRFEDITDQAGVACLDQASTGAVLADIDGDGALDLLVNSINRGVRLFLNDGRGRFHEATVDAGLRNEPSGGSSLALADIDGDGWLDLYVANYRSHTLRDEPDTRFKISTVNGQFTLLSVNGRSVTNQDLVGRFSVDPVTGVLENGAPDIVYHNRGHGRFTALNWTDGTFLDENGNPSGVPYDWALSVMFRDLNGDGAPDIYVCNDFHSEDRIWINDGHGRFRAIAPLALRHTSLFSMGVDFADVDRDGHDDFIVADMLSRSHARRLVQVADRKMMPPPVGSLLDRPQYSRNMLFWNRGDQTYAEIAQLSGLEASDWCWCPVFLDVDLDGYEDLLMVTGHERDAQNIDLARQINQTLKQKPLSGPAQLQLRKIFPVYDSPNFAFHNLGNLTFEEVGRAWGFDSKSVSQGIALADLDNDGDLDVVINCLNHGPLLYRNDSISPRLAVRLRGRAPNTQGIGAKVRVFGGAIPMQSQEFISGGRYLSADDPVRTFAAGTITNRLRIEVTWRDGRRSTVEDARPNCLYEIEETNTVPSPSPARPQPKPLFQDVSGLLQHRHAEMPYDDFQEQPLLPRRLSQGGPGVSWIDLNGDGWDDLVIGSGRSGPMSAFQNDKHGGFIPVHEAPFVNPVARDQTTILGWRLQPGKTILLAGSANYEDGLTNGLAVRQFSLPPKSTNEGVLGQRSSTGPLALADPSGNGRWELFVGGQVIHARYPEPASSLLLRSSGATFQTDPEASAAFRDIGLVNGAVWTDLDGDGRPELVLACEWGPIRVFHRNGTGFNEITAALGLDRYLGWWQSVNVGDFDEDGRPDIIAGNWGRNSKYQSFLAHPLEIYAGDLDGDGRVEIIEAYYAPDLQRVVPWRDWETLTRSMPFILDRYHSFAEFSTASVSEILGSKQAALRRWSANTLDSMLFLNRGDHFEAHPLPLECQLAPVFGLAVADFDGDGHEDLFVAQNFFAVSPSTSRYDAGRGALLKGDGQGHFQSLSGDESGLLVYGEGRGAAVCDYDHDGRADLVVGQNANETKLFHNVTGRPGLRVRLEGPPGNPEGIGTVLRVVYQDGRLGPSREIHSGSGYWSLDSAVPVLGLTAAPKAVRVTWPGGRTIDYPVASTGRELSAVWSAEK
jgi:hypothetical protein